MRVDSLLEPKVVVQGTAGFGTSTLASFFSARGFCLVLIKPASFDTGLIFKLVMTSAAQSL